MTADRAAGGALVVAGLATAAEATTFEVAFLTDPVGPRALPFLVALILVAAGVHTLVRPRSHVPLPDAGPAWRMAGAAAAFLAYAAVLPWLGFFTATTLVVAALSVLYQGPVRGSLATGLALSAVLWLLFVRLLALPLPVGELWIR